MFLWGKDNLWSSRQYLFDKSYASAFSFHTEDVAIWKIVSNWKRTIEERISPKDTAEAKV